MLVRVRKYTDTPLRRQHLIPVFTPIRRCADRHVYFIPVPIVVFMPIRRYPGSPVVARYVFTLFRRCADRVYLRCYTQIRRSLCLRRYTDTSIAMNTPIRRYADRFFCADTPLRRSLCLRRYAVSPIVVFTPLSQCICANGIRVSVIRCEHSNQCIDEWACARAPGVSVYRCTGARTVYRCIGAKNV